jgi:hypothetical protein
MGDVAHNFRSCLDHAAWIVARRGQAPPFTEEQRRAVQFPIVETNAKFNAWMTRRLRGARRADIAKFRRYQPYQRGARNVPLHCLSILNVLSNADKHRTIQPVWSIANAVKLRAYGIDCDISRMSGPTIRDKPLEINAELVRFYVRKTGPNPDIHMEGDVAVEPGVDFRIPLSQWIAITVEHVGAMLQEFASPPQELQSLRL